MALLIQSITGKTPGDLATNLTTFLATLTSKYIYSIQVLTDPDTRRLSDYQAVVAYDSGTAPTVTAITITAFTASSLAGSTALAQAFITANPTYWFAPTHYNLIANSVRGTNHAWTLVVSSTDSTPAGNYLEDPSLAAPQWVKRTLTYASFAAAALTNTIELITLPIGGVIHAVKQKHSAAFTGGTIASYTVSVGITGTLAKYAAAFNVFQAPADTAAAKQITGTIGAESDVSTSSIKATATSTIGNLNAATAGSLDIWILMSVAA